MSKFNDFFWGKNLLNDEKTPSVKVLHREPTSDELVLGWAVNTDELTLETVELTKGISQSAREAHFYVVGATRTGKTKFLESLIEQDIKNGEGFCVIDRHGDLTEDIKGYLYLMKDEEGAKLEKELSLAVNQLGIGPQGLGGDGTAFAVHVELAHTHITLNPVAVNMQCHSARRARATFTPAGVSYGF